MISVCVGCKYYERCGSLDRITCCSGYEEVKNTYNVEIVETLCKTVEIEASSESEAILIAKERYYDEKIILMADDFLDVEFKTVE